MARLSALLLVSLVVLASFASSSEGRMLFDKMESDRFKSLVLSSLPKGTVPGSAPSKKGHASLDNEKLFVRHLASIDRILRSVPSPGVGH